jgi:sodium transport system permease protein
MNGAWLIFKKEMVEFFKDRKTVFFAFVMPLILYPVLFTMIVRVSARDEIQRKGQASRVVLVDPGNLIRRQLEADPAKFKLVPMPEGGFLKGVTDEKVDLQVEVAADAAEAFGKAEPITVTATYDQSTSGSNTALKRFKEAMLEFDRATVKQRLASIRAPEGLAQPSKVEVRKAGDLARELSKVLGSFIPYVLLIVMYAGAMQHGAYMSAGERERSTLMSLLATRIPRTQIIMGKQLALFTLSLLTVLVSLVSMALGMGRMGQEIQATQAAGASSQVSLSSLYAIASPGTLLLCFLLLVPLGFFFTAIVLLIGTQARSTREAQTALTPGIFVVIVLGVFSILPGIEKMAALPYIPVLNVSLAIRKLFGQQGNALEYLIAFGMTAGMAALATWQSSRILSRESSLFKGGD